MKKLPGAALAALLTLAPLLHAQQPGPGTAGNPYDAVSRVLAPIASIFSPEAKQRALSATLVVEAMTGLPPEMAGIRAELFLQPPDRMLLRGAFAGQPVALGRTGDMLWIAPGNAALLAAPGDLPRAKKKKGGLGPMVLPFPPQQMALLPVFLQVRDAGEDGGLRTLEARLMPELARGLGAEEWSARLSLNPAGQLARLRVLGPGWSIALRVERLEYAAELPAATWEPPAGAARLDPRQVEAWAATLGRQTENR